MKQLPMTAELSALIKKAVGEDVDTADLTVFETIALNTKPLPGKDGSIWEKATTSPITLVEMVESINGPDGHIPLITDHIFSGAPKGRFFHAGLNYDEDDGLEMRSLFYLDPTEAELATKVNSASLDEVSVSFLPRQFNCSACGWDYFELGTDENFDTHTCGNGHKIGVDGVHADMVGLSQFVELSLVARGAADKPKIVGKSDAKLAPQNVLRLTAHGITEPNRLIVQASRGNDTMDINAKLVTDYAELTGRSAVLTHEKTQAEARVTALTADVTRLQAELATATTELAAEKGKTLVDVAPITAERDEAVQVLQSQFSALTVATGGTAPAAEALPKTIAELKTKIDELTAGLTAILPTGGRSQAPGGTDGVKLAFDPAAYSLRK